MFGFRAIPPISTDQREWIEDSMLWLHGELRSDSFCTYPTVLPTDEFFPIGYKGTEKCARRLLLKVCEYLEVDFRKIQLEVLVASKDKFLEDLPEYSRRSAGAAGYYTKRNRNKAIIGVETGLLNKPFELVATLAHELCHEILLGGKLIRRNEHDHEFLTDLATVYLGMGVFSANSAFNYHQWQSGGRSGWSASRKGYMSEPMYGYALATYSWMHGERKPKWIKYLDPNIRSNFKKAMRFIMKSGECKIPQYCPRIN